MKRQSICFAAFGLTMLLFFAASSQADAQQTVANGFYFTWSHPRSNNGNFMRAGPFRNQQEMKAVANGWLRTFQPSGGRIWKYYEVRIEWYFDARHPLVSGWTNWKAVGPFKTKSDADLGKLQVDGYRGWYTHAVYSNTRMINL